MADCGNTSVGFTPINDLGAGTYFGFPGFLYPGQNTPPTAHLDEGLLAGQAVVRRDTDGNPSAVGSIAFMSLGMSNTLQEFDRFRDIDDPLRAGYVFSVNGAQSNRDAVAWANLAGDTWTTAESRLAAFSLTPEQVGWIWCKLAVGGETGLFPDHAQDFQALLKIIVLEIASRYPNCKGISFSSRVYGGYADNPTSPEPYAYEGGFAVKWLIESQIDGSDPDLAYGSVPWLGWGPYLWADGLVPRSDGLTYECLDFESDGTHPGAGAEDKVANLLYDFLETEYNMAWFSGQEAITQATHFNGSNTTDGESFDTSSGVWTPATGTWTPGVDATQIVIIHERGAATPNVPTLTGHSITYSLVTSRIFGSEGTPNSRLSVFTGVSATPTNGGLVIDTPGQTQTMCQVSCMEFTIDPVSGIGRFEENSADAVNSIAVTLPAGTDTVGAAVVASFANVGGTAYNTPDGWTEVFDGQVSTPLARLATYYNLTFTDTVTGQLSSGGTQNMAAIIVELIPANDPGPPDPPDPPQPSTGETAFLMKIARQ